jgi:hypothetical protein
MKPSNFRLMAAIFAAMLMGCANNSKQPEVRQTIEVKAKALTSTTQASTTVFSDNDIVSYNGATGEIVFANTPQGKAYEILSHYNKGDLEFYLDGELLFKLNCIVSDIQSNIINEPLLRFELSYNSGGDNNDDNPTDSASQQQTPLYTAADSGSNDTPKWFIEDGYPMGKTINGKRNNATIDEQERDENAKKIMAGFLRFIEVLKAKGKYIEQ